MPVAYFIEFLESQSTIKMEKGYYLLKVLKEQDKKSSQSTIKMEKGYYIRIAKTNKKQPNVAIHNKNGKGLLP